MYSARAVKVISPMVGTFYSAREPGAAPFVQRGQKAEADTTLCIDGKELLAPLKKPAPAYRFRTSPLAELISYIGSQRDLSQTRIRFAGTEFAMSA